MKIISRIINNEYDWQWQPYSRCRGIICLANSIHSECEYKKQNGCVPFSYFSIMSYMLAHC